MSTPSFVLKLREKIGHDPLWLHGVTACVLDGKGHILLGRRADTGEWAMVYGIIDPGEQPADAAAREVLEETGVEVRITDLVSVTSGKPMSYANGDQVQYMDVSFLCEPKPDGNTVPYVGDDESLSVGWFPLDQLPEPLAASTTERLAVFREYLANKANGDAHAMFVFDGERR